MAQRPDRLAGLATVALQHPDLAADQLRMAHSQLGLRGVEISTSVAGNDLSDPALDPFWAAAEQLGSFVFIHPWGCSLGPRLALAYLGNIVGQPAETTVALHHLVFGGVLDRFPALRICAAHGGGYFPHYLARADHAYEVRPESRTMARRPSDYLDTLYFDSLVYTHDTLSRLLSVVGPDHVLLGTDYPFDMGVPDPVDRIESLGLPALRPRRHGRRHRRPPPQPLTRPGPHGVQSAPCARYRLSRCPRTSPKRPGPRPAARSSSSPRTASAWPPSSRPATRSSWKTWPRTRCWPCWTRWPPTSPSPDRASRR